MGFFKPINVGKYVILFSVIVIRSGSHISEDGNIVDDATKWTHATNRRVGEGLKWEKIPIKAF